MESVYYGPSIRCGDCGTHLPWSRTQRHICPNSALGPMGKKHYPELSLSSFKTSPKQSYMKQPTQTLKPTWQQKRRPRNVGALASKLDWNKIQRFQQDELRDMRAMEQDLAFTPSTASSDSDQDLNQASVLSGIPTNQPSLDGNAVWSWEEQEKLAAQGRKYSQPVVSQSQMQKDIMQAVSNRSKTVPDISAAARVARDRRQMAMGKGTLENRLMFDTLISDIDDLMKKVTIKRNSVLPSHVKALTAETRPNAIAVAEQYRQPTVSQRRPIDFGASRKQKQPQVPSDHPDRVPSIIDRYATLPTARTRIPKAVLERSQSISIEKKFLDISTPPRPKRRPTVVAGLISNQIVQQSLNRFAAEQQESNQGKPMAKNVTFKRREMQENVEKISDLKKTQTPQIVGSDLRNLKESSTMMTCHGCTLDIAVRYEKYLEAANHVYHVNCFRCQICSRQISYKEPFWQDKGRVRKDGSYEEGLLMCSKDYEWLIKQTK